MLRATGIFESCTDRVVDAFPFRLFVATRMDTLRPPVEPFRRAALTVLDLLDAGHGDPDQIGDPGQRPALAA
jgi:hypothetical protein